MQVKAVNSNINTYSRVEKNVTPRKVNAGQNVSFQGFNPVVSLMDFIAAGGYAASFILQDGLGFILPRVRHGLLNGGAEKKDENGNTILDKHGKPKHELNWAYGRKEGLRELITGPSAFVIPYFLLKHIKKKHGAMNDVRLDYIDGFKNSFADFAKENLDAIKAGNASKYDFYKNVYTSVIEQSINSHLPKAEKLTADEVAKYAQDFAQKHVKIENLGKMSKKERAAKISEIGTVEDAYMKLRKGKIGGKVNEFAVEILASDGKTIKHGNISELTGAMGNYFSDAVRRVHSALKKDASANLDDMLKHLTNHKMGSRFFTNIGLFLAVALFYTQIPKLYNMGLKGDPSLGEQEKQADVPAQASKNPSFTGGMTGFLEKTGSKVFNNKIAKPVSDIFELKGPIIQGTAMPALLYGFCIPPRLMNAQGKYDYKTIFVRDLTAFTALLFGAKALERLFSDAFTKLSGLALNDKNMKGRNFFQQVLDYLSPADKRHSVLSSKQLTSKYTNLEEYKNGVEGFMDFIEQSGGDVKKALKKDKNVKAVVEEMLGKSYDSSTSQEIREVLKSANKNNTNLMKKFYKLFESDNGLLRAAKTRNSTFGFLSTLVLVPSLIIWLTKYCKKMTERDKARDEAAMSLTQIQRAPLIPSSRPTMAGFLNSANR